MAYQTRRSEHLIPMAPGWTVKAADGRIRPLVGWLATDDGCWPAVWVEGTGLTYFTDALDVRPSH